VQLAITGRALLDGDDLVLADIRDIEHLHRLFEERRPEVVFHAAALKHLTLLERFPGEAVKSNVWGTLSVLEAAKAVGVKQFVNISTDKAADPCSVLGYSKRIAERLTAHVAGEAEGTYLSVRFGNVLGSRGSVLTAFASQVAAGGPVTVTDPAVTRYFMTVREAVQLVVQAAAVGRDGEVLVLDMGEAVSIDGVARRLASQSRRPVQIVYTGLRPGEKLHEDLLAVGERDERPFHPLVSHVPVQPLAPVPALALDPFAPGPDVIDELRRLAGHCTDEQRSSPVEIGRTPASA
jgi:FlaA1/EpsC-like NDP-sugar epimerase